MPFSNIVFIMRVQYGSAFKNFFLHSECVRIKINHKEPKIVTTTCTVKTVHFFW